MKRFPLALATLFLAGFLVALVACSNGDDESSQKFVITTAEALAEFAKLVNDGDDFAGRTVRLGANIMLNDTTDWQNWANSPPAKEWIPIGTRDNEFKGIFDGSNYVISGIYINDPSGKFQGLFGFIGYGNGIIVKNLGVEASYIKGRDRVGGLAGLNNGKIDSSYFSGTVIGEYNVGGLVGENWGEISFSHSSCDVIRIESDVTTAGDAGGLVGHNVQKINNSYSTGTVTGTGNFIGGLVGDNEGKVTNSYSTSTVFATGNAVGGLVGRNADGTIISSFSSGTVTGEITVGGLVGSLGGVINSYSTSTVTGIDNVGGLAGISGSIINSYSAGKVTGTGTFIGGLLGKSYYGNEAISSYYDKEISGQNDSGNGEGKTTAEMQSKEFADSLNFIAGVLSAHTWIYSDDEYPALSNQAAQADIDHFFTSGNGTEAAPYIISTKKQLEDFSWFVNMGMAFRDKYFKLGQNILLNDTTNWRDWANNPPDNEWAPIGTYNSNEFNGSFDGGGFVVSGVYINSESSNAYKGLFGYIESSATIKNLGVTASYINGYYSIGGFAGYSFGKIINSFSTGIVVGAEAVGGFVGNNAGWITNCYSTNKVTGTRDDIGGLVGKRNARGDITNSYYDAQTSGQNDSGKGIGKTTAEMKQRFTFDDWDFGEIWGINSAINDGYPYLR